MARALPMQVPAAWEAAVAAYAGEAPLDGEVLLAGAARHPTFVRGGWPLRFLPLAAAATFGRTVFVRDRLDIHTYVHELVHVAQYVEGLPRFLLAYTGSSAATLARRWLNGLPLDVMTSSRYEDQAYGISERFRRWLDSAGWVAEELRRPI